VKCLPELDPPGWSGPPEAMIFVPKQKTDNIKVEMNNWLLEWTMVLVNSTYIYRTE
jgi:hypothetical protein